MPIIDLRGYYQLDGTIREGQDHVTFTPNETTYLSLVPETGPICKYELLWGQNADETLPFEIELIDRNDNDGKAMLIVKENITLDRIQLQRSEYQLQVVAVRCDEDSTRSERFDRIFKKLIFLYFLV